jgi:hypothetical protein
VKLNLPSLFGIPALAMLILTCTNPLKEPPGGLSGRVFLQPTPPEGEEWAFVRAYSDLADDTVRSDPVTRQYSFDNLKVVDLQTEYIVEAFREGYITDSSVVTIIAGATLVNYDIYLDRGARKDTTFQDGIAPDPSYTGCRDTYISTPDVDSAYGYDGILLVSGGNPDTLKRGLIRFDFNWQQYYPPMDSLDMRVDVAEMRLFIDSVITPASVQIVAVNLLHDFSEGGATWNSNGGVPWPGGPGGSYGTLYSDTLTVNSISFGWYSFDIKSIAAEWLESSQPGAMMIKLLDESRHSSVYFRSADNDSTALHPSLRLAVDYLE